MIRRPLFAALGLALLAGCGAAPAATSDSSASGVEYTRCGQTFTVPAAPQRVLVGWPTSLETLDALGVGDRAIGYAGSDMADPPAAHATLPVVSSSWLTPREALLAARPDLVLVSDENQVSGEQGTAGYADLRAAGAAAYVLGDYCLATPGTPTVDVVYDDVRELGAIFAVPDRAVQVVSDLQARVAAAASLRGDRDPLRVAFVQSYGGKLYALSGSYYAAILQAAGMTNEFADIGQNYAEISPEQVLARRPDVVFSMYEKGETPEQNAEATRAALAGTNARVYALSSAAISGGGVAVVDQIELAAKAAYGS